MADELAKAGLFLDEMDRLRILEPAVVKHGNEVREIEKVSVVVAKALISSIDSLITTMDGLAELADRERMTAVGLRNSLETLDGNGNGSERERRLRDLLAERTTELERLQAEHRSLQLVDVEQREQIEYLNETQ